MFEVEVEVAHLVEVMKFSGKSQESLSSPVVLIRLHSLLIRSNLALIRDPNISFFGKILGADVDEPRNFEGGKVGRLIGDEEVELKRGWFDKMALVEVDEGGIGRSQRRRRVKKEEKTIIGVKGLKIIFTPS